MKRIEHYVFEAQVARPKRRRRPPATPQAGRWSVAEQLRRSGGDRLGVLRSAPVAVISVQESLEVVPDDSAAPLSPPLGAATSGQNEIEEEPDRDALDATQLELPLADTLLDSEGGETAESSHGEEDFEDGEEEGQQAAATSASPAPTLLQDSSSESHDADADGLFVREDGPEPCFCDAGDYSTRPVVVDRHDLPPETLEEELLEFNAAIANGSCCIALASLLGDDAVGGGSGCVRDVFGSFGGVEAYAEHLRRVVALPRADLRLAPQSAQAFERLQAELEAALLLARPAPVIGDLAAAFAQLHCGSTSAGERWFSQLISRLAFAPLRGRCRYAALRVAWALARRTSSSASARSRTSERRPGARARVPEPAELRTLARPMAALARSAALDRPTDLAMSAQAPEKQSLSLRLSPSVRERSAALARSPAVLERPAALEDESGEQYLFIPAASASCRGLHANVAGTIARKMLGKLEALLYAGCLRPWLVPLRVSCQADAAPAQPPSPPQHCDPARLGTARRRVCEEMRNRHRVVGTAASAACAAGGSFGEEELSRHVYRCLGALTRRLASEVVALAGLARRELEEQFLLSASVATSCG
eukprot:TRINITY_DN9206_c0_g1_i1.p1 TRINITY_DN9206_c0_g1~~TRINITY_DN9206_c0_g1_i1.p1  ORF type:complete len:595 (-),score=148.97 TRINITY_DN9206_c0_g1_i1:206-1990(-)